MGYNKNQKGFKFERDVLPWLQVLFPRARRTGRGFEGSDYTETGEWCIEAKNRKDLRLGEWMKQNDLNAKRENRKYPVVIHKRRMFGTHGAYVTMSLEKWVEMLADLQGIELPEDLYPVSEKDESYPDWEDDDE